jgi:hypothetical protein
LIESAGSGFIQQSRFFSIAIQINGAAGTGCRWSAVAGAANDLIARGVHVAIAGAVLSFLAIEYGPTGYIPKNIFQGREGEPVVVDQFVDAPDLIDLCLCIASIVGPWFALGFDKTFSLIFPDPLLRKADLPGHVIDQAELRTFHIRSHDIPPVLIRYSAGANLNAYGMRPLIA